MIDEKKINHLLDIDVIDQLIAEGYMVEVAHNRIWVDLVDEDGDVYSVNILDGYTEKKYDDKFVAFLIKKINKIKHAMLQRK